MFTAPVVHADQIERGIVRIQDEALPIGCVPFIADDLVDHWAEKARWSPDELAAEHGNETVRCFAVPRSTGEFLQQASEQRHLKFADFVAHAFGVEEGDELYYLRIGADDPLFECLASDLEIPPILDRYQPAATGIWMGQRGNVTPFHHDWWHSCLAQIRGRKRYVLIHPLEIRLLQTDWNVAARYDLEVAPRFEEGDADGLTMVFDGTLGPGQMLYIPPYWLHQVDTLDNGTISMPIRFDTTQSPDVDLFQLSQDSLLRPLTNEPVSDARTLVEALRENRARFERAEREFVEAFCDAREPGVEPEEILAAAATD